jgi:hypothetical protein
MTPCSQVDGYQHFGESRLHPLQTYLITLCHNQKMAIQVLPPLVCLLLITASAITGTILLLQTSVIFSRHNAIGEDNKT